MNVHAWMVKTMPRVEWRIADDLNEIAQFLHISTSLRPSACESDMKRGETVWAAPLNAAEAIYLAWEWVEARPGLVALSDPNSILTNSQIMDLEGRPLDELKAIQATNVVAHRAAWQRRALEVISAAQGDGKQGHPGRSPTRRRLAEVPGHGRPEAMDSSGQVVMQRAA